MRNRRLTIVLLIVSVLLVFLMFSGVKIGNFEILSISQLKNKNNELNDKINFASRLTAVDYPSEIEILERTYEDYIIEKERYEEVSGFTTVKEAKEYFETKQYDISYLWKTLGKYATMHNLTLGMEVKKDPIQQDIYSLNFNVSGQYVNISEFISDIENDSDLYFRIYNFKMSGSGETITATFTVKGISIDPDTIIIQTETEDEVAEENETEEKTSEQKETKQQ